MLPDAEALIRRSGAAAPLLNAVRERSARDAVRSVIERLTGAPPAAAPAAAIPAAEQTTAPGSGRRRIHSSKFERIRRRAAIQVGIRRVSMPRRGAGP